MLFSVPLSVVGLPWPTLGDVGRRCATLSDYSLRDAAWLCLLSKKLRNSFGDEVKITYLCAMNQNADFVEDEIYGGRLLISTRADQIELNDNIRVARVLLHCFIFTFSQDWALSQVLRYK